MANAEEITCKIIPLYRVRLIYNDDHVPYERHIVSDSILGIITGLIDIEIPREDSLDEATERMTFDIQDFLYMPCAGTKRGFHLFDIDEVDCAAWSGSSIDNEIWYHCYFSGDKNVTGNLEADANEAVYSEPRPVADVVPQPRRPNSYKDVERSIKEHDAIVRAIYRLSKEHPYRATREMKEREKNREIDKKAMKRVKEWIAEEEETK